jgi:uncharacterized membrane-anchored protein
MLDQVIDLGSLFGQAPAFDPIWLIGAIIGGLIFLAIIVFIDQYIYKDAMDKGLQAEMWLLICVISPVISWIIYFIVRKHGRT